MTRRRALWLLGAGSLVVFAVLAALDAKMVDEGGWGIVDFELAGSRDDAREMVAAWGSDGRDAARLSLWLDYLYIATYVAFWVLAIRALRDLAARRGLGRLAAVGTVAVAFPIGAGACDALENAGLLLALGDHGGSWAPAAAMAFALAKFVLLVATLLYALAALAWAAWKRWRVPTAAVLAALALLVAAVVVIGVSAGDETKAAASGGQTVRLPGGDLYVEDAGRRGPAALVLLHGYTASTRWWSRVTPALARRHRIVNVDLLGHGRSQKPRDGYEMAEQARLVLTALRRLGVRRAVVVGHSMGGWVAVSMAEQDPAVVRGVATIGTGADRPEGPGPLAVRVGRVPVLGGAIWQAVPDSYVRSELESAFADGVPVPDAFVEDTRSLTWRAYAESSRAGRDFREARAPYERMRAAGVPLLAMSGSEDDLARADAVEEWELVPGVRVVRMEGVGHTPQWERPGATVAELERFAAPRLR